MLWSSIANTKIISGNDESGLLRCSSGRARGVRKTHQRPYGKDSKCASGRDKEGKTLLLCIGTVMNCLNIGAHIIYSELIELFDTVIKDDDLALLAIKIFLLYY